MKIVNLIKSQYNRYFQDFFYKLGLYKKAKKNLSNYYNVLSIESLMKHKKSDTIFVLGSGFSINDLDDEEIEFIENNDTFAFNGFLEHYNKMRIDFFLAREFLGYNNELTPDEMRKNGMYDSYFADKSNKLKTASKTIFFLQHELAAYTANNILANKMIKKTRKIITFKNHFLRKFYYPTSSIKKLVHYSGTISDVVHACYAMKYKHIVLVGVDLYDRNHFWLPYNKTSNIDAQRGANAKQIHNTANPTIKMFEKWQKFFIKKKVKLYVYNPKSLLNTILPIYKIKKV